MSTRARSLRTVKGQLVWYTTATLPFPASVSGAQVWNLTTGKAATSDGTYWREDEVATGPLPSVSSLSVSAGPVGGSVVITGSGFLAGAIPRFNGLAAVTFTRDSDTQITATVPVGASTGPVTVDNGAGVISAAGPTFTVGLDVDLVASLPSEMVAARAGGTTIYRQTSASACVAETGAVREDRGGDEKGQWTFPGYTNAEGSISDFSGWSTAGAITRTPAAGDAPDGTVNGATKIEDSDGASQAVVYRTIDINNFANRVRSIWFKGSTPAPTSEGGLHCSYNDVAGAIAQGVQAGVGSTWRRRTGYSIYKQAVGIFPAGYNPYGQSLNPNGPTQIDNTQTGAVLVWGVQEIDKPFDLPLLAAGATTQAQTLRVADGALGRVVQAGDFDCEAAFISSLMGEGTQLVAGMQAPSAHLFSGATADGALAFRYDSTNGRWILTVRGADIGYVTHRAWPGYPSRVEVRFRVWYKPALGTWGIRLYMGGCIEDEATGATVGGALAVPTSFYLGSDLGASSHAAAMWTRLRTFGPGAVPAFQPEFIVLGDSICSSGVVGAYQNSVVGSGVYTITESRARAGIKSLAVQGHKVQDQEALFNASPHKGQSYLKAVIVQVGVNNLGTGLETAATVQGRLAQLFANIKAAGHRVIACKITPCKSYLTGVSGTAYGYWQTINAGLAGMANVDEVCDTVAAMQGNGATDDLPAESNVDNLHDGATGRYRNAQAWRASLVAEGLL